MDLERQSGVRLGSLSQMQRNHNDSNNDITLMGARDEFERLVDDAGQTEQLTGVNFNYGGVNRSTGSSSNAEKLKLKFEKRSTSVMACPRDNVLAIPKPSY